ncbi:uncharacterized protein LOC115966091 [Quercus lobata]|uniref:DUF4220 domain-containing protein n=1 Tax=Quercus lobata TaxID=97700 RepID=A0A7N2RCC5_QUELO|nr:uncharacterized protein LOC115966091 [Quercus lobata]XP_030941290.1 uncharacterized protein LOC115966091 [Quercus lobata]
MFTTESVQKLWNKWEIRVLVLISLALQLSLFHFGRQRRYNVKAWIHIFLWLCYLVADSVATVALGVISSKQGNSGNDSEVHNELMAFWAPFMLLHLGGQDTITAYSIQDNELWLRHLLGLIVQSSVALYIFIISLKVSSKDHWLSLLTIPMLVAGFIKYAERIFVMRLANDTKEGGSFHSAKMYANPTFDGFDVYNRFVINFRKFRPLFRNQKMVHYKGEVRTIKAFDFQKAFKLIEIFLGLAYDDFYTKAPLFSKAWGCIFRGITFSSTVLVFVFFVINERHKHLQTDLIITYILLGGALVIEIYAVILLIASDMAHRWLYRNVKFLRPKMSSDQFFAQKWSNTMGQFNMLSFGSKNPGIVLQGTPKIFADLRVWFFIHILPKLKTELEMLFYKTNKEISDELKRLVWDTILEKADLGGPGFSEDYNQYLTLDKSVNVDIDESIIIWHLATEICFYTDNDINAGSDDKRPVIKEISHYMMYILALCPFMFSVGSAKVTFQKSCSYIQADLLSWVVLGSPMPNVMETLKMRLSDRTTYPEIEPDNGELVKERLWGFNFLPCAYAVAQKLGEKEEQKWEILIKFWVENLAHVATLCQGNNHAQQLRNGGEFLSHVWLLIEHMDLKEKFRVPLPVPQQGEQTLP